MASEIESLETTSSSLSEDSLNISFDNITYTVRSGILAGRGRKNILSNLSGEFNAGELTVIMGQSGAGKSSLMDILSGYTKPSSGRIYVNGRIRNEKKFRRRSCYILQDDKVHDQLSVRESLGIAAELKLGNHISTQQKCGRIEEIIKALKMQEVRNTRAGYLSGGQKKRLAIGLELISDPPVMFLDEPTSGLDCSMSKQMVRLLRELAQQGRTVIVTIHQPSATLLQKVDRLYAIVGGKCAYMGSVPLLRPYLEQMHLTCPPYHNPVDFLIEKCDADNMSQLVQSSENGRSMRWIANTTNETDYIDNLNISSIKEINLTSLPPPKENPTNKIMLAMKSTYSTSRWNQFTTLTRRSLLSTWRDPSFLLMTTGIHLAMALSVGLLFFNIGVDAKDILNNFNFLYFSLMFLMFTAFSAVSISFPEQIPVVRREHFNRWYTTGAYYASTLVSILPTQTVCTLIYACITYWMTGQPFEFERFSIFATTLLMVSYVAICIGLLNGSMFNVQNGVVFGPCFFIMPFTIFSGFFLRYGDAPYFFRWLFHISFLKHGLVGLVISIYGMGRPKLTCTDKVTFYCHYRHPKLFMHEYDMDEETFSIVCAALLFICVVVITSSYIMLRIRLKHKW